MEIIRGAYERLRNALIENLPFEDLIPRYDHPHTLFYLHPPYVGFKGYNHNFDTDHHPRLAETLREIKGKFILSYNDCRFVRGLYKGFKIRPAKVRYTITRTAAMQSRFSELTITNY